MAVPRATRYRARHARPTALPRAVGVAGLATVTTFALLPGGTAGAEPAPTLEQVQRSIGALDTRADAAVEDFRQAEQQLAEAERRTAAASEQVTSEQARLQEVRTAMGQVVVAAYRRGGTDRMVALVTDSDPQSFLDRAAALDRVARSQSDVLADVQTARLRLDQRQAAAQAELERERAAEGRLAERRAGIEAALAEQKQLLDGLEQEQRRQVEAARAAAVAPPAAAPPHRAGLPQP